MSSKEIFLENLNGNQFSSDNPMISDEIKKSTLSLKDLDFPTSRTEKWKYTRVSKIIKSNFNWQTSGELPDENSYKIDGIDANTIVLIDGEYSKDLSDIQQEEGVEINEIKEGLNSNDNLANLFGKSVNSEGEVFTALNTVFMGSGIVVDVAENITAKRIIHLVILSTGNNSIQQPRSIIRLQKSSKLEVIISFISNGENKTFTNHVAEFFLEENSKLEVHLLQSINSESFLINEIGGEQKKDSNLQINTLTARGHWIRNNTNIKVRGSNCETNLYGAYLPKEKEHIDNHTIVDHIASHCESNEMYKGIMSDNSTAVFNGKVYVREDAQKTNAYQQNANILLSDDAQVYSKPELEIYADDVKCSHGSTTGQFDQEALFYLMARGIAEQNAKKMLVSAFIADVIDVIDNEQIKDHVNTLMEL